MATDAEFLKEINKCKNTSLILETYRKLELDEKAPLITLLFLDLFEIEPNMDVDEFFELIKNAVNVARNGV